MKNIFFIIGLPRTRSAWLANFLTNGDAFCHHELFCRCNGMEQFAEAMQATKGTDGTYMTVGDADPTLCSVLEHVIDRFPDAKFLVVDRVYEDVVKSQIAAYPSKPPHEETLRNWQKNIRQLLAKLPREQRMQVDFYDLHRQSVCAEIHTFLLGRTMRDVRWALLHELRVTTIAEKAYSTLAPWAKVTVAQAANPMRESNRKFYELVAQLCARGGGFAEQARSWLTELWALALMWDHLTDHDAVNIAQAELALEAVTCKWPLNAFYLKHAPALAPVLSNALSAWRNGSRERQYDIYTEPALAVAFLFGGLDWQKQFSGPVRDAAKAMMEEDDKADGSPSPRPYPQGEGELSSGQQRNGLEMRTADHRQAQFNAAHVHIGEWTGE